MPPIGIAVVGAGPWGLTLTNAFAGLSQAQLRWICDLDEERRARARAARPEARVTADLEETLADPDVEAVVVAVDPARHHAVSMRALKADKHLFVEKPLALSACDAEEIRAAAIARGRVLAVGHVLLHNLAIRQVRQIVTSGLLGEPLAFASQRTTAGAPRRPGSAWWALAPHDVSLALYLFGGLPTTVSATASHWGAAQEDNAATALLRFPGGRTAHIQVARFASKRREVALAGTRGTLTFDELAAADQALRLWTPSEGRVLVPGERADALRAQCLDFLARIAHGDARADDGSHAVDVVRVLEAGERAMRQAGGSQPLDTDIGVDLPDPAVEPVPDRLASEAG